MKPSERPEDVEALAHHFLEQFTSEIPAFRGKGLTYHQFRYHLRKYGVRPAAT